MARILRWIRDAVRILKEHFVLCGSLLIVGFLIGLSYRWSQTAESEPPLPVISTGNPNFRDSGNPELQQKALQLVAQVRSFAGTTKEADTEKMISCDRLPSGTEEERRRRWQCMDEGSRLATKMEKIYNERYKGDMILLVEELLHRLPKEYRSKIPPKVLFGYPTNPLGLEEIATGLELLAKSLPER